MRPFRPILVAAAAAALAGPLAARADAIEDFYTGKTIKLTIPTPAGASFDLYGRTLASR